MELNEINPYWTCQASIQTPFGYGDKNHIISLVALTIFGSLAGYGLTSFVQSTFPISVRRSMIKTAHFFAAFVWTLGVVSCQQWLFGILVAQTFLYGSEPYDNLFSATLWKIVWKGWKRGEKLHLYWAISSVLVHVWFVGGAGALMLGLGRPRWIFIAIFGFSMSHTARVFSYNNNKISDIVASICEVFGNILLCICIAVESSQEDIDIPTLVWLCVSTAERLTHIPSALVGNVGWMRSYDLWEAACKDLEEKAPISISQGSKLTASSDTVVMMDGAISMPSVVKSNEINTS